MNHYLDIISRNHELNSSSDFSEQPSANYQQIHIGGETKNKMELFKSTPTGCFPPIYRLKKEDKEKEKTTDKTRAFAQIKNSLSIKEIMESRRVDEVNSNSFITL